MKLNTTRSGMTRAVVVKDSVIGSQLDRNTYLSSVILVSEMANVTSYQRLNIQTVESEKNYYKNSRDTFPDLNVATMLINMLVKI